MSLFQGFSLLPQELQDIIWDFTVQNEPSLHFFRLTASAGQLSLEAPRYKQQDQPSWTINNSSYYSHFRALWNTCRASRKAVERYKQNPMVITLSGAPPYVIWNRERDILCLQPSAYKLNGLPKLEDLVFDDQNMLSCAIIRMPPIQKYSPFWEDDPIFTDMHMAVEYCPSWWEDRGGGSRCFNLEICTWAQGIVITLEDEARRTPTFYVIDTLRKPRSDGHLDMCSRRPAFESATHYYFEVEEFHDELFGEATEAVYWFAEELHEGRIVDHDFYDAMGGLGLCTEIYVVAAIPKGL